MPRSSLVKPDRSGHWHALHSHAQLQCTNWRGFLLRNLAPVALTRCTAAPYCQARTEELQLLAPAPVR